jgi:hypothetical protein
VCLGLRFAPLSDRGELECVECDPPPAPDRGVGGVEVEGVPCEPNDI